MRNIILGAVAAVLTGIYVWILLSVLVDDVGLLPTIVIMGLFAFSVFGPILDQWTMPNFWELREARRRRKLFCVTGNNGVSAVVLWRDLAAATELTPGVIPRPIVRRVMTFSDRQFSGQPFLTGTLANMEDLLRGQQKERASFFVPFSSGVHGTFEEQTKLCPPITFDEARRLVKKYGQ